MADEDGLEPTGSYWVTVIGSRGTCFGVLDPIDNTFEPRDYKFVEMIGQATLEIIINALKPKLNPKKDWN